MSTDWIDEDPAYLALGLSLKLGDQLDVVQAFQGELAEVLGLVADGIAELHESTKRQLDAMRPRPESEQPAPDPLLSLDNVLNGLALIVQRIDQLKVAMDKKDSDESVISFDQYGYPAKITRADGSELVISRDLNRRQISLRRRR
jgi:hypothetical protein